MDIYDVKLEGPKAGTLDKTVKLGQKVEITRVVTIKYTMDVDDFLDEMDLTEITLEELINRETDVMSVWDIPDIYDDADVLDETVTSVEIS